MQIQRQGYDTMIDKVMKTTSVRPYPSAHSSTDTYLGLEVLESPSEIRQFRRSDQDHV